MSDVLSFRIVLTAHPVDFVGETIQLDYGPYSREMSPFNV
jgi:hypothetical protein